ncbi:hypothetical protein L3Q82_014507 [Scortum barcoo]|uniref:Uncharacterized protein n=1 Tax=Scortum barcoo TaxID=214431 RepID=A0ACB8VXP2_9TELE|nr:hypothetical protein L3Q82_014507 [Scortum barcoo]
MGGIACRTVSEYVQNYHPHREELQHLRILLHGPTLAGSGKSSFINSVDSVLQGRITARALADADSQNTFTKKFGTYKIQKGGPGTYFPFVFSDIMGLEKETGRGVGVEDIKLAHEGTRKRWLQGILQLAILTKIDEACPEVKKEVRNVYKSKHLKGKFNPASKLSEDDQGYNKTPTLNDQVHVLVCVISANTSNILSDEHVKKMRDYFDSFELHSVLAGIPQLAILTKIDEACPEDKKVVRNVYKSKYLKEKDSNKHRDLQFVRDYEPHNDELNINISEFCFMDQLVLASPVSSTLSTVFYKAEQLTELIKSKKEDQETFYPFVFNDIMGLEKDDGRGVHVEDIKLAMKGHFNPASTLSEDDQGYNKTPTLSDQVHVLVCVISASTVNILSDEHVKKMRNVRLAASDMGIPQLAILTKIDEACPEVKKDVRNVYKSKKLKEKMEELSFSLGLPLNCIFPVKNYHSEIDTDDDIDTLILSALKKTILFGEDFVNDLQR